MKPAVSLATRQRRYLRRDSAHLYHGRDSYFEATNVTLLAFRAPHHESDRLIVANSGACQDTLMVRIHVSNLVGLHGISLPFSPLERPILRSVKSRLNDHEGQGRMRNHEDNPAFIRRLLEHFLSCMWPIGPVAMSQRSVSWHRRHRSRSPKGLLHHEARISAGPVVQ
jgi:hypothetical protein